MPKLGSAVHHCYMESGCGCPALLRQIIPVTGVKIENICITDVFFFFLPYYQWRDLLFFVQIMVKFSFSEHTGVKADTFAVQPQYLNHE